MFTVYVAGMRLHLDHVNLSIDDVAAADRFYGALLGLEPAPRPNDAGRPGAWYRVGAAELHLSVDQDAHTHNAASLRHVALEVPTAEDLTALRQRLADAGVPVADGRPLGGVRRFFVRDPAGNRIELFQRTG